jgi:peptidoglycan/xylan/chitin deacetylase (PgdA/CDA1 family)
VNAVAPPRIPVLMYHEIADVTATPSRLAVAPEVFADQLAFLRDAGYTALTAGELAGMLEDGRGQLPERPVVLTFDDGYGDFYDHALPLLKQNEMTGTVFATTGWIGLDGKAKRMLSWRQIDEVIDYGVEIGAHTIKHPQLDQLPHRELREELSVSKELLENKLGRPVPGLAYPFGYSNAHVREVARELGYAYAYAVGNSLTTTAADHFALPRLTVRRGTTMDEFRRLVNGENTPRLRRDRMLSRGYSVIRRTRSSVRTFRESLRRG